MPEAKVTRTRGQHDRHHSHGSGPHGAQGPAASGTDARPSVAPRFVAVGAPHAAHPKVVGPNRPGPFGADGAIRRDKSCRHPRAGREGPWSRDIMEELAGLGSEVPRRVDSNRPRVVVGVDESDGSRAALRFALHAAAARSADLEVVSTFPTDLYWADVTLLDAAWLSQKRESTRNRTWGFVDQVRSASEFASPSETPVHVTIGAGAAVDELLRQAVGAELLVVGAAGTARSAARCLAPLPGTA